MKYDVTFTEQAENDLRGIFEYIAFDLFRLRMQPDSLTGSKKKSFPWESIRRSSGNMKESPGRVEIHELCLLIIMLFSISPIRQRNWLQ